MAGSDDEHEEETKTKGKSRRELPPGAVATLKAWLLSPEHFTHPYPTPQDQVMLMQKTGIDKKQLKNWFTNARRRIWKPMLKKQMEQGKLTSTGAGGGGVAVAGVVPGLMVPTLAGAPPPPSADGAPENPHSVQAIQTHYQQAVQQSQQPGQPQQYANPVYVQQAPAPAPTTYTAGGQTYYATYAPTSAPAPSTATSSPGPTTIQTSVPVPPISKNDSHAVLMELFARDQDLVRQATESAKVKQTLPKPADPGAPAPTSQHPMRLGSSSKLVNVPTLNSWPHFSSISSLNNLGAMTGVKSITSMSGADLASQGNLNKMGNLAKVKSMESMGRNDSYAFLEVFFGDRSSKTNLAGMTTEQRGVKREREDDNDVGLCLDDEAPTSSTTTTTTTVKPMAPAPAPGAPVPAPLPSAPQPKESDTETLKRAYDDALAARGLISVSRSSEDLTDLALPAKMRKTLSQQFLLQRQQQAQAAQQQQQQQEQAPAPPPAPSQYQTTYSYSAPPAQAPPGKTVPAPSSQQYPGQHPQQQQAAQLSTSETTAITDPSKSTAVEVPSATRCALCGMTGVDTQLRPCGHMFHERCVKPSLQTTMGQPKCPVDNIPMHSAILAVPTDKCKEATPAAPAPPPPPQPAPIKAPAPLGWAPAPPPPAAYPAESTV